MLGIDETGAERRDSDAARAIPGPNLTRYLLKKGVSAGGDRGWMEGLMVVLFDGM